jgi:hypothetical protein
MGYKIKHIYQGENLVRPSGWTPWSNTVMYYPFKDDQLDKVGNSSISLAWTKETIWYTFNSTSNISISNMSTLWRFLSMWIKLNSYTWDYSQTPSTYIGVVLYNYRNINHNYPFNHAFQYTSNNTSNVWVHRPRSSVIDISSNVWHHLAYGTDWTKIYAYVDWNIVRNENLPYPLWSNWWTLGMAINETISEFICESVCWTAQEVSDYYNQTKSKYWL